MRNVIVSSLMLIAASLSALAAEAATPQQLVADYAAQAKRENPSFRDFSVARGAGFYRQQRTRAGGAPASCSGCHTADPTAIGRSRANKDIAPLAPVANAQRFTDAAHVEKWFSRNCTDVLERACTAQEKGDFITYLLSVK